MVDSGRRAKHHSVHEKTLKEILKLIEHTERFWVNASLWKAFQVLS